MASRLKKVFASVALAAAALSLAGCGESPQDLAAKSAMVQQMVGNSISTCETGPVHGESAAYAERLTKALSRADLKDLQTLQDHHVTVCLDQRLMDQKTTFWGGGPVRGVHYPGADGQNVMTYKDSGGQPAEEGFWTSNPAFYRGGSAVGALARKFRDNKVPSEGLMTANLYGKSHYAAWKKANTAPNSAISLNPQLQQPPLKMPPSAKPGS